MIVPPTSGRRVESSLFPAYRLFLLGLVVSARATPLAHNTKRPTPVPPSPPPRVLYHRWEEPDPDPLRLDQPTDKQDPGYRPNPGTRRRRSSGTAYHRTKSREDDGDEFGEVLRIPPAFNTASPPEKDIEEGTPLPAPTENPLDQTENETIQRRNDRVERRRIPESYNNN